MYHFLDYLTRILHCFREVWQAAKERGISALSDDVKNIDESYLKHNGLKPLFFLALFSAFAFSVDSLCEGVCF